MKKLSLCGLACAAFFVFACNDNNTSDPIKSANESNEMKLDSAEHNPGGAGVPVAEADAKFAVEAASGGMTEVQLGELAQQKAQHQRVKDFGAMMVRDHTAANDELKSLSSMKNITLPPAPGDEQMKTIRELTVKSGKDFDKAYMKAMVKDHEEDVNAFEKAEKEVKDPDVHAFVVKTLPVLRAHLDSARAIHDAVK